MFRLSGRKAFQLHQLDDVFDPFLNFRFINAILLKLTGELVNGFEVEDFWSAIWGALVISIVTLIANSLTGKGNSKVHFKRAQPRERPPDKRGYDRDDDDGPVIDV